MVDERKAAVADGEQPQRAHQRRPRADEIDEAPGQRCRHQTDRPEGRDDRARICEPEVPDLVEIDDQEREDNPVSKRVCDTACFEQPDGAGQLRIQSADVRGDGIHARERA